VPFGYGIPTFTISAYCNLGFTPWHFNLPYTVGSGTLANYFATLSDPPVYTTDFLNCDPFNSNLALFECIRYSQNGAYHYAHNPDQRAEKIADFFAPVVQGADCQSVSVQEVYAGNVEIWPNPFDNELQVRADKPVQDVRLFDATGREVFRLNAEARSGDMRLTGLQTLVSGVYVAVVYGENGILKQKMVVKR
jgi:hypothetical protein